MFVAVVAMGTFRFKDVPFSPQGKKKKKETPRKKYTLFHNVNEKRDGDGTKVIED